MNNRYVGKYGKVNSMNNRYVVESNGRETGIWDIRLNRFICNCVFEIDAKVIARMLNKENKNGKKDKEK